jgi:uncharacterized membrane protein (DUF2068 family)
MNFLPIATICVGGWMLVNGVLHDIFVLRSEHGKQYDRTLLRLLMDGHILITCGTILVIAAFGLQKNEHWAYYIAGVACISMLIYCAMIFPFLKSIVTIVLNLIILILLIIYYKN